MKLMDLCFIHIDSQFGVVAQALIRSVILSTRSSPLLNSLTLLPGRFSSQRLPCDATHLLFRASSGSPSPTKGPYALF
jgi:hypothetical protein